MENKFDSFEDLHIWQESMTLCKLVYLKIRHCKDYGLKDQLQRSAVSIPSNIAEGFELSSNRSFIRHLNIAKGSSGELRTQIYIAINENYIHPIEGTDMINHARKISSMIQNFITYRKKILLRQNMKSFLAGMLFFLSLYLMSQLI